MMSSFSRLYIILSLFIVTVMAGHMVLAQSPNRIVSVGGSVTEIIYALGQQDRLISRDRSSTYPEQVMDIPDIGYKRTLSSEGVLSVAPDLILAVGKALGQDEAVAAAAPDVIPMIDHGGGVHWTPNEDPLSIPALIPTPAAQNGKVIRMSSLYLLGFGPRTAYAITELSQALYSENSGVN